MKSYFLLIDTETTQDSLVADFAAVVCDRKGRIATQCAVLVNGIYTDPQNHPLFFTSDAKESIWSKAGQDRRYATYRRMLKDGVRMLATVAAINSWLAKAKAAYNPILTAYNLPFDQNKCANSAIDLTLFDRHFCLWAASSTHWAKTKAYRKMVLQCHAFNPPTDLGNMTFKTNAETMARFVAGNPDLPNEPHTALEDIIFYELPILRKLLAVRSTKWILTEPQSYDWRACQVKDWFKPA